MPKLIIETCERTPNVCAIEAISMFMFNSRNGYMKEQELTVKSGRRLKVQESDFEPYCESPCSCTFTVTNINTKT